MKIWENPVLIRELREKGRITKLWITGIISLILTGLLWYYIVLYLPQKFSDIFQQASPYISARGMFIIGFNLIFGLISILVLPAFMGTSFSHEWESRTMDMLLVSKLRPFNIFTGKLASGCSYLLVIWLTQIPFDLIPIGHFGGINSSIETFTLCVVLLLNLFCYSMILLSISSFLKRVTHSVILCYVTLIFIIPTVYGILYHISDLLFPQIDSRMQQLTANGLNGPSLFEMSRMMAIHCSIPILLFVMITIGIAYASIRALDRAID